MPLKACYLKPDGTIQRDLNKRQIKDAYESREGLLWVDITGTTEEDGKFLEQWQDFLRPTDVKIDKNNIVYVSELCQRVSILTIDGKVLTRFGNQRGRDQKTALFLAPHTIAVDSRGDIYVGEVSWSWTKRTLDRGGRVVQKFARK